MILLRSNHSFEECHLLLVVCIFILRSVDLVYLSFLGSGFYKMLCEKLL